MESYISYTKKQKNELNKLIQTYEVLVKNIAHHLIQRLPKNIQLDDLIQVGMLGLLDAAKNYDSAKGANFATYASIRIRGMMLDEVRRNDWLPRSAYRNARVVAEATKNIEARLKHDATDAEISAELGISLEDYHTIMRTIKEGKLFGFEDLGIDDDVSDVCLTESTEEPFEHLQQEDFACQLSGAINSLPEKERLVMSLYYDQEYNLKEIGKALGVSESRVCQIHGQAVSHVREKMPDWANA